MFVRCLHSPNRNAATSVEQQKQSSNDFILEQEQQRDLRFSQPNENAAALSQFSEVNTGTAHHQFDHVCNKNESCFRLSANAVSDVRQQCRDQTRKRSSDFNDIAFYTNPTNFSSPDLHCNQSYVFPIGQFPNHQLYNVVNASTSSGQLIIPGQPYVTSTNCNNGADGSYLIYSNVSNETEPNVVIQNAITKDVVANGNTFFTENGAVSSYLQQSSASAAVDDRRYCHPLLDRNLRSDRNDVQLLNQNVAVKRPQQTVMEAAINSVDSINLLEDDDLSLPRSVINKLVKDAAGRTRVSAEARDLFVTCCHEFVRILSSIANTCCELHRKKLIGPDHILTALTEMGLDSFKPLCLDIMNMAQEEAAQKRRRISSRYDCDGLTADELKREQQELFAKARQEHLLLTNEELMNINRNNRLIVADADDSTEDHLCDEDDYD